MKPDVPIAAVVHGEPVRRQKLGRAKAGTKRAERQIRLPVWSTIVTGGPSFGTLRLIGSAAPSWPTLFEEGRLNRLGRAR
jgi:hypothetical protein